MTRIITLTIAAMLFAAPAYAQVVTNTSGARTLSPGDTIQAGAAAASTSSAGASALSVSNPTQVNTQINTQVTTQSTHVSQGQEQGQGQLQGQGQGQEQSYQGQQNVSVKTDVPRQAPPAVPAALAVSSLTCYGSWSIAASTPFGGVGAGFPTKDTDCERSRNALIFVNLGMQQVALALLSQNPDNAKAMQAAGVKYPGQTAAAPASVTVAQVTAAPAPVVKASEPVSPCGKDMEVSPSGFCRWKK